MARIGGVRGRYLTPFLWNILRTVGEAFCSTGHEHASGNKKILVETTSQMIPWPITDGFLGLLGYVFDALFGLIGGVLRWRTMPWAVILFGVLVGPLGAVSIGLVITQPLAYNTFCTLCMFTAVISVVMIGPAMDEMLASLQYMRRVQELNLPFWRYFWGRGEQEYLPDPAAEAAASAVDARLPDKQSARTRRRVALVAQLIVALTGIYLMAAPGIWGYTGAPEKVDRFIGPLVASFGTMALWEVLRNVRWLNLLLGVALAALALSPWPWPHPREAMISDITAAAVIVGLTLLPYPTVRRYGGGWMMLLPGRRRRFEKESGSGFTLRDQTIS